MNQRFFPSHVPIKLKRMHLDAIVPTYESELAGCFDLYAIESRNIYDSETPEVLRTGWAVELPPGFVMLILSRSGHGFKNDVRLSNCVGVIDADYRGEVCVKLTRDTAPGQRIMQDLNIQPGDRIAQAMVIPYPRAMFEVVEELSNTKRGTGGFGSTDEKAGRDWSKDDPFGPTGKGGFRIGKPEHMSDEYWSSMSHAERAKRRVAGGPFGLDKYGHLIDSL